MKRAIITVFISFSVSVAFVTILNLFSDNIIRHHNNFLRLYPHHPAMETNTLDIKYNSYYIAGATANHIYLGNVTAPLHLLVLNKTLTDTQSVTLGIKDIDEYHFRNVRLKVDSPYFFLTDGMLPGIFRGKLSTGLADRFMYNSAFFNQCIPIGTSSFALRSTSAQTLEHTIAKETANPPSLKLFPDLLEKQIDGIFCTDGTFQYNSRLNKLIYVYYYRNQYIVMDTNLTLAYRANTIDTFSRAQIKVVQISSNKSRTLASPPLVVNKSSCTSNKWLFIHSNLLAKNDEAIMLDQASIIDVYDLTTKSYQFSFYVYDLNGKRMKSFLVVDNLLIALFDHHVVTYDLVPKLFQESKQVP